MTQQLAPDKYLQSLMSLGIRLDLNAVRAAFAALDNPERSYPAVLIAGTNGKGSVTAMTGAILSAAGRSVGLYTSPHLTDVRERIRIDGEMISPYELTAAVNAVAPRLPEPLTYFEFLTVLAGFYFRQRGIDIAVVEVGMGGRLDATREFAAAVTVITNLSLDHQEFLGARLADIAGEKAAIIPAGGQCITGVRQRGAGGIIAAACRERGARLLRLGREIKVYRRQGGTFSWRCADRHLSGLHCGLAGAYQQQNAALAIAAATAITSGGPDIGNEAIRKGLAGVKWEGRLEILQKNPTLLVDGAHNPSGIGSLCRALQREYSFRRLIVVFGVLRDKHYRDMLKRMAALNPRMILTCPGSDRALPPAELLPLAGEFSVAAEAIPTPAAALQRALEISRVDDLICVTGSLYLVGEIKKLFLPGKP